MDHRVIPLASPETGLKHGNTVSRRATRIPIRSSFRDRTGGCKVERAGIFSNSAAAERRFGVFLLCSALLHAIVAAVSPPPRPVVPAPAEQVLSVTLNLADRAARPARAVPRPPAKSTARTASPKTTPSQSRADETPPPVEAPATQTGNVLNSSAVAEGNAPTERAVEKLQGLVLVDLQRYFADSYPPIARRLGWQGTVALAVTIRADGTLDRVRVARSSGYEVLDRAALTTMQRVPRVAAALPWLRGAALELSLPIVYRLTN